MNPAHAPEGAESVVTLPRNVRCKQCSRFLAEVQALGPGAALRLRCGKCQLDVYLYEDQGRILQTVLAVTKPAPVPPKNPA